MWDDTEQGDNCPHCGANLVQEVNGQIGYRMVSVEIRGVYDGGLFWMCPDCEGRWHRWPKGHYLRAKAHRYVCDMGPEGEEVKETT